jgi:site-specific DNA recombinase
MNQFELIQSFAKGKASDNTKQRGRNAVIYTRVSTKEQADTNQSLETQKKYCLQYALKHELNVLGFFGGTYESAKTDERNEFNRMIRSVKNQEEGVSAILARTKHYYLRSTSHTPRTPNLLILLSGVRTLQDQFIRKSFSKWPGNHFQ